MKKLVLSFLIILNLYAIEENNLQPFYSLESDKINILLSSKDTHFCKIKNKDYLSLKDFQVLDCYPIEEIFSNTLKKIQLENQKEKELSFVFINSKNTIQPTTIQVNSNQYKLMDFIYNTKDRTLYIEVFDKNGGYFFFTINPQNVHLIKSNS